MGGASNVLGHVAAGFEGARQADLQRQFEDVQNRRALHIGLLSKLAQDETVHPDVRNWALQSAIQGAQTPLQKNWEPKWKEMPTPTTPPQQATPPPAPPLQVGQMTLPPPPPTTVTTPGGQPSTFMTPEQHTAMLAQRTGVVTGAQAGAEVKQFIPTIDPQTREMRMVPVSGTGQQMGQPIENAFNMAMMRPLMSGVQQIQYVGPDGTPLPGSHDKLGLFGTPGAVYDQQGQLVPNAQIFAPSLVTKTTGETIGTAGNITRKMQPTPRKAGAAATAPPQISAPPTPPAAIGGVPLPEMPPEPGQVQSPQAPTAAARPVGARGKAAAPTSARGGAAASLKPAVGTPEWIAKADPVSLDAWDWATQGRKPVGGPMAERQVRQRMAQMGFMQPAIPVPPNLQDKIQQQFVARNSAIDIIDDIMKNKQVFDSLLSSGKIAIASNPDGTGLVQRMAGLTDQESRVAGDFEQLIEHANLLRGPLGATGFRGQQAWSALQAQRGKPLGDPRITSQVLTGMRTRLVGLNSADKLIVSGQGMSQAGAEPHVLGHKVGDVTTIKGKQYKITAIHDDGSFDADTVGATK